jgi:pyruvyltransferase
LGSSSILPDVPRRRELRQALVARNLLRRGVPRSYWFREVANFGDDLAPDVLGWALGVRPEWVDHRHSPKILGLGSLMHRLGARDTVWGTGAISAERIRPPKGVTFLAVRGPLTRDLLDAEVPAVYGDPALLLPRFHNFPIEQRHEVGIVPHYVDLPSVEHEPRGKLIDVRRPWRQVVDDIRSCRTIVSSSLHGLIVAEAYGIPAAWTQITDDVAGDGFKFRDYYASTGRDAGVPAAWGRGLGHAVDSARAPAEFDTSALLQAVHRLKRNP